MLATREGLVGALRANVAWSLAILVMLAVVHAPAALSSEPAPMPLTLTLDRDGAVGVLQILSTLLIGLHVAVWGLRRTLSTDTYPRARVLAETAAFAAYGAGLAGWAQVFDSAGERVELARVLVLGRRGS